MHRLYCGPWPDWLLVEALDMYTLTKSMVAVPPCRGTSKWVLAKTNAHTGQLITEPL